MPAPNDRALWDLFDQAQTGELQAAESRKWGLTVNPHYLRGGLGNTISVARSMSLVPWIQEVYIEHGSAYLETDVLKNSYRQWHELNPDESVPYEFYDGLLSLERTGLINRGSKQDDDGETSPIRSVGKRAVEANYREVIHPPTATCLGLLARGSAALAVGAAATWGDMELFDMEVNSVGGHASQVLFASSIGLAVVAGMSEVELNVKAAQVHRQYAELGY